MTDPFDLPMDVVSPESDCPTAVTTTSASPSCAPSSSLSSGLPDWVGDLPLASVLPKVQLRWCTNEEIASYLYAFDKHASWLSTELMSRPSSGTLLLYDRRSVRYRKDGYLWKTRKSGKLTREDHMKLKVKGVECLYGCYVHSALMPKFHRRSYWLLENPDIVLVHYLNASKSLLSSSSGTAASVLESDLQEIKNSLLKNIEENSCCNRADVIGQIEPMFTTAPITPSASASSSLHHADMMLLSVVDRYRQMRSAIHRFLEALYDRINEGYDWAQLGKMVYNGLECGSRLLTNDSKLETTSVTTVGMEQPKLDSSAAGGLPFPNGPPPPAQQQHGHLLTTVVDPMSSALSSAGSQPEQMPDEVKNALYHAPLADDASGHGSFLLNLSDLPSTTSVIIVNNETGNCLSILTGQKQTLLAPAAPSLLGKHDTTIVPPPTGLAVVQPQLVANTGHSGCDGAGAGTGASAGAGAVQSSSSLSSTCFVCTPMPATSSAAVQYALGPSGVLQPVEQVELYSNGVDLQDAVPMPTTCLVAGPEGSVSSTTGELDFGLTQHTSPSSSSLLELNLATRRDSTDPDPFNSSPLHDVSMTAESQGRQSLSSLAGLQAFYALSLTQPSDGSASQTSSFSMPTNKLQLEPVSCPCSSGGLVGLGTPVKYAAINVSSADPSSVPTMASPSLLGPVNVGPPTNLGPSRTSVVQPFSCQSALAVQGPDELKHLARSYSLAERTTLSFDDDGYGPVDAVDQLNSDSFGVNMEHMVDVQPVPSRLVPVVDVVPESAPSSGGSKILLIGPWDSQTSNYSVGFDDVTVPAALVQKGVLRCFAPAHQAGNCRLVVLCNGNIFSNVVNFRYTDTTAMTACQDGSLSTNGLPSISMETQLVEPAGCQLLPAGVDRFTNRFAAVRSDGCHQQTPGQVQNQLVRLEPRFRPKTKAARRLKLATSQRFSSLDSYELDNYRNCTAANIPISINENQSLTSGSGNGMAEATSGGGDGTLAGQPVVTTPLGQPPADNIYSKSFDLTLERRSSSLSQRSDGSCNVLANNMVPSTVGQCPGVPVTPKTSNLMLSVDKPTADACHSAFASFDWYPSSVGRESGSWELMSVAQTNTSSSSQSLPPGAVSSAVQFESLTNRIIEAMPERIKLSPRAHSTDDSLSVPLLAAPVADTMYCNSKACSTTDSLPSSLPSPSLQTLDANGTTESRASFSSLASGGSQFGSQFGSQCSVFGDESSVCVRVATQMPSMATQIQLAGLAATTNDDFAAPAAPSGVSPFSELNGATPSSHPSPPAASISVSSAGPPAQSTLPTPYDFKLDSPPPTTQELNEYFNAPSTYMSRDFSQLTLSDEEQRKLYEAAKIIQNAYRNFRARKQLALERQRSRETDAAVLIQSYYRRYKQYVNYKRMIQAATVIQNQYRRHAALKRGRLGCTASSASAVKRGKSTLACASSPSAQLQQKLRININQHRAQPVVYQPPPTAAQTVITTQKLDSDCQLSTSGPMGGQCGTFLPTVSSPSSLNHSKVHSLPGGRLGPVTPIGPVAPMGPVQVGQDQPPATPAHGSTASHHRAQSEVHDSASGLSHLSPTEVASLHSTAEPSASMTAVSQPQLVMVTPLPVSVPPATSPTAPTFRRCHQRRFSDQPLSATFTTQPLLLPPPPPPPLPVPLPVPVPLTPRPPASLPLPAPPFKQEVCPTAATAGPPSLLGAPSCAPEPSPFSAESSASTTRLSESLSSCGSQRQPLSAPMTAPPVLNENIFFTSPFAVPSTSSG